MRLALIVFIIIHFGSISQNLIDNQGRKQGEWIKYFENSKVPMYKGEFKDDLPIGKFIYYYPSSKIKAIVNHDDSGRSESFLYHENKNLMAYGIYINQKKDSIWTHYGPSERISFSETYQNGVLNGKKIIYYVPEDPYDNKIEISQELNFLNGRLNGECMDYFPGGILKKKCSYNNGVYDGIVTHYHPSGQIMLTERWKNRKPHGWWITYNNQGKEVGRSYYKDGDLLEGEALNKYMKKLKELGANPND